MSRATMTALLVSFAIAILGISVLLGQIVTAGLVIAASLLVIALRSIPAAAAFFMVIDVSVRTVEHFVPISAVSSLDDASALLLTGLSLVYAITGVVDRLRLPIGSLWMAGFAVAGIVSGLVAAVPMHTLLPGLYLACKGWLVAFAFAQVDWRRVLGSRRFRHVLTGSNVALILVCGLNLAIPAIWARVFSVTGSEIIRYGLPSLIGPFVHPFDLALVSATCAGLWLATSVIRGFTWMSTSMVVANASILLLTFRRKELAGLLIAFAVLVILSRSSSLRLLALLAAPVVVFLFTPAVATSASDLYNEYVVDGSDAARTVLTVGSFQIANSNFPLGVGFGRFASRTAAVQYSPIYNELGYGSVWGLQDNAAGGSFLTDTAWPAIVGETGYLGALMFVLFFGGALAVAIRKVRHGDAEDRLLAACVLVVLIVGLTSSVAAPIFTSPPGFGLMFGAVGVISSLSRIHAVRRQGTERAEPASIDTGST